jgi:hypothetical protein
MRTSSKADLIYGRIGFDFRTGNRRFLDDFRTEKILFSGDFLGTQPEGDDSFQSISNSPLIFSL